MAAPTYAEDLTDIDLAESGSTGWTAFNISGGGGGTPAFGADFGMQGAGCWDKAASNAERAAAVNKTPGAGTVAAGVHIFQWGFNATPGVCDTLQNRGAYVLIGTGTNAFVQFHVEGSDTYGASGRVARCYPVRYVTTANTGSVPYRTVSGNPGATPTYFGFGIKTLSTVKGSNFGVDAVRYGTGAYISAGELANPATFDGFATQNDNINNRWGILTKVGTAYELQGRFAIGQNTSKVPTTVYFEDSDRSISIADTPHSDTDFTEIHMDGSGSTVNWTNINITALGTHNKGSVRVQSPLATVNITGGTWTGLDATVLGAATTIDGLTWRQCGQVSNTAQGSIQNCVFDRSASASSLTLVNLSHISNCTFISDGSNHAVELVSLGGGSMSWDSNLSGYVTGVAGSPASTSSTGNEAIYVNVASGTLTINLAAGASIPSIRSAGATVNVVAGQKTFTQTISPIPSPDYEYRLYEVTAEGSLAGAVEITAEGEENATSGSHSYSHSETNQPVAVQIISNDYIEKISYYTLTAADLSVTINLELDNND